MISKLSHTAIACRSLLLHGCLWLVWSGLVISAAARAQEPNVLAVEGERFKVSGTQVVRYGAQSSWVEKTVTNEGECSNRFFGYDPLVGVKKTCRRSVAKLELRHPEGASSIPPTSSILLPKPLPQPSPIQSTRWGTPRDQARIFVSGHSLTDDPYGEHIVRIANSLGSANSARFNQQIGIGSPIRVRTGMPRNLDGYSIGKNRPWSSGMNVLDELKTGRTIGGERYDTLILTENHNLLEMMQWENTVRQVRHYHDRLVENNPAARTFLHFSWWNIDKSRPEAWMEAERIASLGWQCVGARINRSLQLEGRSDRVLPLPMSMALVDLVGRAANGELAVMGAQNTREALGMIFADNVHLTRTAIYYASLVSYAAVFERSPVGSWHPPEVNGRTARWLQELAWSFAYSFYSSYREPTVEECLGIHMSQVCDSYWTRRGEPGRVQGCRRLYEVNNHENPLRFSPSDDAQAWFPAAP